tara:strand:+ start:83 stop:241 length:159 start_codon:yes stop_codon:yes gene_type:complete
MMTLNELVKAAAEKLNNDEPTVKLPIKMNRKQKRTQAALARRGQRIRRVKGM